jgi:CubicO group peptidase (beta-lactamase class C family)
MAALPMDAQPGTEFVYGYNTDILGALVEEVSGQPLDEFIAESITGPLGMRDTYFYLPSEKAQRLAVVYSVGTDGLERTPDVSAMVGQGAYVEGPRQSFSGGAGLLSTSRDYGRFLQMTLNGGELDGARVLSPKTVELMTVSHIGDIEFGPGRGFGLGFQVVTDIGAYGQPSSTGVFEWGGAYHSTYWVDPVEELVVSYFTQVLPATGLDDHGKLRALVYQAIIE